MSVRAPQNSPSSRVWRPSVQDKPEVSSEQKAVEAPKGTEVHTETVQTNKPTAKTAKDARALVHDASFSAMYDKLQKKVSGEAPTAEVNDGTLRIDGTRRDDAIRLSYDEEKDAYQVHYHDANGDEQLLNAYPAADIDRIELAAHDGDDLIRIDESINRATKNGHALTLGAGGNGGNDTIINSADHATIVDGDGDDTYLNEGDSVQIRQYQPKLFETPLVGNDTIYNLGDKAYLQFNNFGGSHSVHNWGDNMLADLDGFGERNIESNGDGNQFNLGAGVNNAAVTGHSNEVNAGHGLNNIGIAGDLNSVNVGNGVNEVGFSGNGNQINAGAGANTISGIGELNSVKTADGMHSIGVSGDNNQITTAGGASSVTVLGSRNTIDSGSAWDSILAGRNNTVNQPELPFDPYDPFGLNGMDLYRTTQLMTAFMGDAAPQAEVETPAGVLAYLQGGQE